MERKTIIVSLFCLAIILILSCNSDKKSNAETSEIQSTLFDINSAEKIIREKTNRFTAAHISRDTAFLNNCFTKDARIFPPNSDVVTGKEDIAQLNHDWVSYGIHEFTEVSTSFYGNEEYLIDEGTYSLRYGEDNITDEGKYINIWKNVNGVWKICSNIWNSSIPLEDAQ